MSDIDINKENINKENINKEHINLTYYDRGTNGLILKFNDNIIYKLTSLNSNDEIFSSNIVETLYLNYFKLKYNKLYENDLLCNYYPIQNFATEIINYKDFLIKYNVNINLNKLQEIFLDIGISHDNDFIIINKMYNHQINLYKLINKDHSLISNNIDNIVKNIINGLHMIHSSGLLHGDLKSSNIVYSFNHCKIIDFGGFKPIYGSYYVCTCTSTNRCPEDLLYDVSKKNIYKYTSNGIKSDIWSLGIILLEIIIGSNPILEYYNRLTHKKKMLDIQVDTFIYNILSNNIFTTENIKNYFKKLNLNSLVFEKYIIAVSKMLELNPDDRYNSLEEIYKNLFNEEIHTPLNTKDAFNFKINNIENKNLFIAFRNNNFRLIIKLVNILNKNYATPLILNILDKYYIKSININNDILFNENNDLTKISFTLQNSDKQYMSLDDILLFFGTIIIGVVIIYKDDLYIKSLFKIINNIKIFSYNFNNDNITDVISNLIKIIEMLSFDLINDNLDVLNIENPFNTEQLNELIERILDLDLNRICS